jgi:hypothetical protein
MKAGILEIRFLFISFLRLGQEEVDAASSKLPGLFN